MSVLGANSAVRITLLLGCLLPSCSDREMVSQRESSALAVARTIPAALRAISAARPLSTANDGFHAAASIAARLPRSMAGSLHIERSPMIWVDVTPENVLDHAGQESAGIVTYPGTSTDSHALMFFDGTAVEDLRVLESPRAASSFSWRLRLGPGLERLEVREGLVQLLDVEGRARLRTAPLVAWDSAGHTRALEVAVTSLGPGEARLSARLDTTGLSHPIVVDPAWGSVSTMAFARIRHTMLRLPSGKVLVAGGSLGSTMHSSAEVFDPATLGWTLVGSMKVGREYLASAVMPSGKVLAVGGRGASGVVISAAEIFDPASGSWTDAAAVPTPYSAYPALVTVGSQTLMPGGSNSATSTDNGWVFTESTGAWTVVANKLSAARAFISTIPLSATRAWIVGGNSGQATDFYDTTTSLFSPGPTLNFNRGNNPGVVRLTSGRALVVGNSRSDAELYDPTTGLSLVTGIPVTHPLANALAALPGDRAIFVGASSGSLESSIFEGSSKAWSVGPNALVFRVGGTISDLADGRVLVAGGTVGSSTVSTAELFGDSATSGTTCSLDAQCASGFCSSGVCCDRACTGTCESCTETSKVGTCTIISGAPRPGHGTCGGSGTCAGTCDGTAATCTAPGSGTACVAATCVGGIEQPAAYCTGTGTCEATPATKTCAPFACGTTGCKTSCTVSADCTSGSFCNTETSKCEVKRALGAACKSVADCVSGSCASDGKGGSVCCDKACAGGCETCGASGAVGTCQLLAKDATCGADACVGSALTKAAVCDGASAACPAPSPTPCAGSLICADGKTCKTTCATGSDCTTGYCDLATSKCAAPPGDGGVVDSGGAIAEAGAPILPAKPTVPEFQRCIHGSDCSTGFCVDGVCCDTACDDRCHSCALLSSPGKCTAEPIGVDLRSECGPANQCLGTCDGAGACIGSGTGTMCGRNRCVGPSNGVGPAYCTGPGAKCPLDGATAFDCGPYTCEPAFGACMTSCVRSEDCSRDFVCDLASRQCVARPAPETGDEGCQAGRGPLGASGATVMLLAALGALRRRHRA